MNKPKELKENSTIGIISPSYWLDKKLLKKTSKYFIDLGYNLKLGSSNFLRFGPFAGTPQDRADDIHNMFKDPAIDAIICARGGYGANKVLPLLDYDLIKENPKIFLGYSDITAFLISITQKTDLITFHGPMLSSFNKNFIDYNYHQMLQVLQVKEEGKIFSSNSLPIKTLKSGSGFGKIWGGNMTLLINRLGTNDALATEDIILFIEDVDEYFYSFERNMIHLYESGMFKKIKGLIIGELYNFQDQDIPFGKDTDEIVMDICGDLDIPIISNFPCGHGKYQCTIPLSLPIELNATNRNPYIEILETAVERKN
jgi:muramoyltetrapeptide carboxypeptidase